MKTARAVHVGWVLAHINRWVSPCQVVSEASQQRPEEVYVAPKHSRSEAEEKAMTHSDRRRVRAAKKRTFKKRQEHQVRACCPNYC